MNLCKCGCGDECNRTWVKGHNHKGRPGYNTRGIAGRTKAQWQRDNADRLAEARKRRTPAQIERYKTNGERHHYKKSYGLTVEEAYAMKANGCAICGAKGTCDRGIIVIDHDHDTGQVRGTLCEKCNRGIGHLRDDVDTLLSAAEYLRQHKG